MSRLRVLFLTDRHDAPYRYRCVHGCAQLRASGALANVLHVTDPNAVATIEKYSVAVLFRLRWCAEVESIVHAARRSSIPLVFDCDDLVFDPGAAALLPFRRSYTTSEWEASYGNELTALRRTFDACDSFIGSTPALAEWATRLGKPARSHPNVAPDEYLKLAPWVERFRARRRPQRTIGYFSGSNTHNLDLAAIAPAVRRVLQNSPTTRFLLAGFVDSGQALAGFEHRVVRLEHVSFRALPWAYAGCDVTIAPISELTAFSNAKSALKFFEPGAFGVPVVATPIASMQIAIEHGVSGWLADSDDGWVAALEAALEPGTALDVGQGARRAVRDSHSSQAVFGRLANLLAEVAVPATGKEPPQAPFRGDEYRGRADLASRTVAAVRRTFDLATIRATLGEPIDAGPSAREAKTLVDRVLLGKTADEAAVLISGSPTASGWHAASQIQDDGSPLGESRLTGSDPHYVSPPIELVSRRFRYAILHIRASSEPGHGSAHLFWQANRWRSFRERDSAHVTVANDGTDRTYVIDLWKSGRADLWRRGAGRLRFRLDPLDRPGSARVLFLGLVPEGWRAESEAAAESRPIVALDKGARAARGQLSRALSDLAVDASLWIESPRDVAWVRNFLARALAGSGCVVDRLETRMEGVRALVRRSTLGLRPGVDIVVPVHNARTQTIKCLASVLRHAPRDVRVMVIDDASTDPELWPALLRLRDRDPRVVLRQNPENLGFVRTSNRGFAEAAGRDVLLLNSDTHVFRGFVQRLQACAYADSTTGLVCPLSNNATICSVPDFCRANDVPAGMSAKQMAALVRKTSRRAFPELVTPVGFCMYVRAALLAQVGHFDAELFGRGFGEENDLGERAKALGWRIRLADDVYVWHEGKASFGGEGLELERTNSRLLEERHPGYHARVAHFVERNPLAPIHEDLRWHLGRWRHRHQPSVMMMLHASPLVDSCGGTEYVVRDLVNNLRLPRVVVAYPGVSSIEVVEVLDGDWNRASRHRFSLEHRVARICQDHDEANRLFGELLDLFRVSHVHIHHLLGWPLSLGRVLERRKVPHTLTVHDFYCVCPSQNMLDVSTYRRCCPSSIGDAERTSGCMRALFSQMTEPAPDRPAEFVDRHRRLFAKLYSEATRVFFPSSSTQQIVASVHAMGAGVSQVLPHAYLPSAEPRPREKAARLRVGLLGEIGYPSKGARGYLEIIEQLGDAPIEWHIFGNTERFDFGRRIAELGSRNVIVQHGSYAQHEIVGLLQDAAIDVGLLLPIWPETFSLTLSEFLGAGVPVIASRQGAVRDRLEGVPYAFLVDSPDEAAIRLRELSAGGVPLDAPELRLDPNDVEAWLTAHRQAYARRSKRIKKPELRRGEYQRLYATRVHLIPSPRGLVTTTEPAARYRSAAWYQSAERLKPHLPESIRALARRALSDQHWRPLQSFRIPSRRVTAGDDVRLEARYLRTARFSSLGSDPCFYVDLEPIAPQAVRAIRFNVWCSHHGYTYAQIYWRHEGDSAFHEEKSLTVELQGGLGDWQTYVVELEPKVHASFFAGKKLTELRFDPVNYAGLFCVGEISLCVRDD